MPTPGHGDSDSSRMSTSTRLPDTCITRPATDLPWDVKLTLVLIISESHIVVVASWPWLLSLLRQYSTSQAEYMTLFCVLYVNQINIVWSPDNVGYLLHGWTVSVFVIKDFKVGGTNVFHLTKRGLFYFCNFQTKTNVRSQVYMKQPNLLVCWTF